MNTSGSLRLLLCGITALVLSMQMGCGSASKTTGDIPIVTRHSQLDQYDGQVITIQGEVSRTKLPTIIGVYIDADYDLSEIKCQATGRLTKWIVTEQESAQRGNTVAHAGAGTFYSLTDVNTEQRAKASRMKE